MEGQNLTENPARELEKSRNQYIKPVPKEAITDESYDSPAHVGPFKGAIDISVPLGTPTLAPLEGVVVKMDDTNDRYGTTKEFADYVNYITIRHANNELSQVLHLEKGSVKVKLGDKVRTGQIIAKTGNSGWMTAPHLHFFVFENLQDGAFRGLEIRFKKQNSSRWYNPRTWIPRK